MQSAHLLPTINFLKIFVGQFRLPDLGPGEDAKHWYKFLLPVWLGSGEGVGEVVGCSILVPVHCHGSVPLVVPANTQKKNKYHILVVGHRH
jgi:hypothetical protein